VQLLVSPHHRQSGSKELDEMKRDAEDADDV